MGKVHQPADSFTGCLFNVVYNNVLLPLWPSVLHKEVQAVCCRKSSSSFPAAVPTFSAVTFYGFSHVSYDEQILSPFSGSLGIQLKFRTFAPDAVMLLLTRANSVTDYCGIFLNGGKVQGYVVTDDAYLPVETQQTYNTGNWYQVSDTFPPSLNYPSLTGKNGCKF